MFQYESVGYLIVFLKIYIKIFWIMKSSSATFIAMCTSSQLKNCLSVFYSTWSDLIITLSELTADWSKGVYMRNMNDIAPIRKSRLLWKFDIQHFQRLITIGLSDKWFVVFTNQQLCYKPSPVVFSGLMKSKEKQFKFQ